MKKLALAFVLLGSPALAQQSAQDRVATQIGQLVIRIETQQDQITSLQQQIEKSQARLKELEAKKDDPPKQ